MRLQAEWFKFFVRLEIQWSKVHKFFKLLLQQKKL